MISAITDDTPDHHYATLLGLGTEWKVTKVGLDVPGRRIDVFLESAICPVCGKFGSVCDQQAERVWRHLDTVQFETPVHAKTPRVKCADHRVKVTELPWAAKSSRFTLLFDAFAIDVLSISNALTEGFNTTIQALKATAKGCRNFRTVILFCCDKPDMRPDLVRVGASF